MKSSIQKFDDELGIEIPEPVLRALGLEPGDPVEMHVENGVLVIVPVEVNPDEEK